MKNLLRLQLLGPIQVQLGDSIVIGFESRKAKALLCYLAYVGHPVSRSKLVNLFWENKTELQGLANLSRVIHNIQNLIPGYLNKVYRSMQFTNFENCWIDTKAIEDLGTKGDVESLKNAVELFRGDFMEDICLANCPEFNTWLDREQELWRQKIAEIYSKLINIFTRGGRYDEGIAYSTRLLALQPWREEAHRQMMVLLMLTGSRLAAIHQYEICQKILVEELGILPSEETQLLYQKIRTSQSFNPVQTDEFPHIPVTGGYPSSLPNQPPLPVDTENELSAIIGRLKNPTCRMLTLLGSDQNELKDHLALHTAAKVSSSFQDGVFYHPLSPSNQFDSCIRAFYEKFSFRSQDDHTHGEELFQFLRDKEMLLVMTNVVSSPPVVSLLEGILKRSPFVKILLTALQPVGSSLEWIYDVPNPAISNHNAKRLSDNS